MINPKQFTDTIIRPALSEMQQAIGKPVDSPEATRLMLLTALAESRLEYLRQIKGPAISFYQVEPATIDWLHAVMVGLVARNGGRFGFEDDKELRNRVLSDMFLATWFCRMRYWVVPARLPDLDDAQGMAVYHKEHYNTYLGAADPKKTIKWWDTVVEATT